MRLNPQEGLPVCKAHELDAQAPERRWLIESLRGDNPRAFVADLSKNLWYCFTGCRAGGDVVELARRLLGLSYWETACYLASLAENAPKRKGSGQGIG